MSEFFATYFIGWLYVGARVFGLLCLLPFWEGSFLPLNRLSCAAAGALAFSHLIPHSIEFSVVTIFGEFLLGLILGMPVALLLELFAGVGELFDSGRGQTIAALYGAGVDAPGSVSMFAGKQFLWVFLLMAGILEHVFAGLLLTFQSVPAGRVLPAYFISNASGVLPILLYQCSVVLASFLPLSILFFSIEIVIASIQVILPNISLQAESFLVKSFVGGIFVCILICLDGMTAVVNWVVRLLGAVQTCMGV